MRKIVKNKIYQLASAVRSYKPEDAVLLFCDPRGGSTWLAELLVKAFTPAVLLDEPFHLNNNLAWKNLHYSWRSFIPEHAHRPRELEIIREVLSGKKWNSGNVGKNSIGQILKGEQVVAKIIRGKALLPWIVKNLDLNYQPVLLIRHPLAMVASQMRHSAWNYPFQKIELPLGPDRQFFEPHIDYLRSLPTKEEQLVALWCMTNQIPLSHPLHDKAWVSVFYENLVLDPKKQLQKIFTRWKRTFPEALLGQLDQPSSTTTDSRYLNNPLQQISKWQDQLSLKQIDRLLEILEDFNIDIYGKNPLPLVG